MHVALQCIGWTGARNAQALKSLSLHYECKLHRLADIPVNRCLCGKYLDVPPFPDSRVKIRAASILNALLDSISNPPEQCSRRNPSWAMYQTRCPRRRSS
jgi:hypothetical protein